MSNTLDNLERRQNELYKEVESISRDIKQLRDGPKIDLSKLPVDTLIEVRDSVQTKLRHFATVKHGRVQAFDYGMTSALTGITCSWDSCRILEGKPVFWQGGECPLPDGVEVRVFYRGPNTRTVTCVLPNGAAETWNHHQNDADIIGFQIQNHDEWITPGEQ